MYDVEIKLSPDPHPLHLFFVRPNNNKTVMIFFYMYVLRLFVVINQQLIFYYFLFYSGTFKGHVQLKEQACTRV